jgi:hypothetical protein
MGLVQDNGMWGNHNVAAKTLKFVVSKVEVQTATLFADCHCHCQRGGLAVAVAVN